MNEDDQLEFKFPVAHTEASCNINNGNDIVYVNSTLPSIPPTDYSTNNVVHVKLLEM